MALLACRGLLAIGLCIPFFFLSFFHLIAEVSLNPGPRIGHVTAFDEGRGRVVLFGGFGPEGVPLGDTWEWDGARWRKVAASGPSARKWAAMAYDSKRGRVLLFGGLEGVARTGSSLGDTWEWNGMRWSKLASEGPTARDHHALAYDRARDRTVLFGGWDGHARAPLNDTWEWDGGRWEKLDVSGPSARAAHGMAFDEERGATVLFGGRTPTDFFQDTWLWDGREWVLVDGFSPTRRSFHAMVYDSQRKGIVMFGGCDGPKRFGDTWFWSGTAWRQLEVAGPSERYSYSMAFDRVRHQVVFFGGGHRDQETGVWVLYDETWLWEGRDWMQVH